MAHPEREIVAKAILEALRKEDPGAYIGSRNSDDDLTDLTIDGSFNLLIVADAVLDALED